MNPVPPLGRILVVDDNADMRLGVQLLLEREGYEVAAAPNGARALELVRRAPPDVLITDIFMPEIDGLEIIARCRKEFPSVKIIAISGGGDRIRNKKYLSTAQVAGADAVLPKPFAAALLLETLRGLAAARPSP
jgi:CheY-like chemotaxis protein